MKHLLHYFPNHPREEECYIRLAGYREEEEIDELIYRTVGRIPGSEFHEQMVIIVCSSIPLRI